MKQSITLKLSHGEVSALAFAAWNVSACLLQSKGTLQRLAGWHLHKFHHRMNEKCAVSFAGKKVVRVNLCETLSLHAFIMADVPVDLYTDTVRREIFTLIDSML